MSQKGDISESSNTGSEIKSGESGSYTSAPWVCGGISSGEASSVHLENSSKEINPSSSKTNHQSNCDNYYSSDEKIDKRRSRNNLKLDFWDENLDSHGQRILRRPRREVDRIADSDSKELEKFHTKHYEYKGDIRNLKLHDSNFNLKESHTSQRAQRSITLQKKKRARRRSYDNRADDSTEISDDESESRKSKSRKRGAIRYNEINQRADSSDTSKKQLFGKRKAKPNQSELEETSNTPRDPIGDIKENQVDNTKDEINDVKSETSEPKQKWWMISQKTVYGLGHISNDLCAAMWFSYMMLFFQAVMEMKSVVAGYMMLLGQVVDALATPAAGILVDRLSTKKFWHLVGSVSVIILFPVIFIRCIGCSITADPAFLSWWMPVYYAGFIIVFQIGWAIVEISHLAMIPAISESSEVRAELTSIRTMASMLASITVYLITWIILETTNSYIIGPDDDYKFRNVALTITGISITTTSLFHIFFKLKSKGAPGKNPAKDDHKKTTKTIDKILFFLKMPSMYFTSLLYVFSRLYWTLSLIYVPLFLEERLAINPIRGSELVASVPLVVYIASFIFSLLLKKFIHQVGNQIAYLIGSIVSVISCVWIGLCIHPKASIAHIYLVAIVIGAGSETQVSSLSITADLIGPHSQQGAIVYSIVTFADKLFCGIVVVVIEHLKCDNSDDCPQYYRWVLSYACGISAVLGILTLCIQVIMSRYNRKK